MKEKIVQGYTMNIGKNAVGLYQGSLISDDVVDLCDDDMNFLDEFSAIDEALDRNCIFLISYDADTDSFVSEVKQKEDINGKIVFKSLVKKESSNFFEVIDEVNSGIGSTYFKEERLCKKI